VLFYRDAPHQRGVVAERLYPVGVARCDGQAGADRDVSPPGFRLGYLVVPRRYVIDQRIPRRSCAHALGSDAILGPAVATTLPRSFLMGRLSLLSNGIGRPHRCGGIVSDSEHTAQTGGAVTSPQKPGQQGPPPSAPPEPSDHPPSLDRRESGSARWRETLSVMVELAGIGVLSAGFWLILPWAGLIVLAVGFVVLGIARSPKFDRRRPPQWAC
jgi:hypothetical protein